MATLRSDPAFVQRLTETARAISDAGRAALAASMSRLNANPGFAAKRDAKGRRMMVAFSADPAVVEARTAKTVIAKAMRLARRNRIPLHLVDEFRALRKQGVPAPQAAAMLARANPAAFRAYREAEAAKLRRVIDRRAFGPVPMGEPPFARSALAQRMADQAMQRGTP